MVFFTCANCGESMKKPSVAKHYMTKCRVTPNVTCVDCFKDFRGNEYEAHIKCVTEDERYAAKGYVPKPSSNKGEKKQQSWFEAVQNLLNTNSNLRNDERELLQLLSNHENLPRKKGKFLNFLNSAHKAYARRQELVERVWNLIESVGKAATAPPTNKEETKSNETNGVEESKETVNGEKKRKGDATENGDTPKKKQKTSETNQEEAVIKKNKKKKDSNEEETNGHDNECESVLRKLLNAEGGSLSFYKLGQAMEKHCATEAGVEKAAKMLKKLQKKLIVRIDGDQIVIDDA